MKNIHQKSTKAKQSDLLYGGITILFIGDFYQLDPVGQSPLYKRCLFEKLDKSISIPIDKMHKSFGRFLWLKLSHVIILTEQMRQKK